MKSDILSPLVFDQKAFRQWINRLFVFIFILYTGFAGNSALYAAVIPSHAETDSLKSVLTKKLSPKDKIKTLYELGKAYYAESDHTAGLKTDNELLEVISQYGTKADSAKCFRLIGLVYMQMAWYDKSLENFMRAQQLFDESGDTVQQAKALMNIGTVHDFMGNLPMSLSYYERALVFFKSKKNENGIADCELNIAILLSKQKKYEQANENLISAAGIYEKTGNIASLAAAYINLGLTYKKLGNYDLAIEYHNKAYDIWKQQDDQYHICYYHLNMGEILLDLNKSAAAGVHLVEAERLAKILQAKDLLALAYEYLADYNAARKNFAEAYTYLNKSKQLNDSILNAETTGKVNQIQYHYEIAAREAENQKLVKQNLNKELLLSKQNLLVYFLTGILVIIAIFVFLLVKQNRIRNRANKELEVKNKLIEFQKDELIKLNASKDKFLSILSHDIRNPLSSIFSLSDILVTDYKTLTDEEKLVFISDIHTLSINLFEIINTLLTWSTSQSGMITYRPKPFLIADLCRQSVRNLQTVAKQKDILLVCKTDESLSVMADENMILSVLHNLINNAIKHAKASEVLVQYMREGSQIDITVEDNGVGFKKEAIESKSSGMGLSNLRTRVAYLKGDLDFQSQENEGTTVNVHILLDAA